MKKSEKKKTLSCFPRTMRKVKISPIHVRKRSTKTLENVERFDSITEAIPVTLLAHRVLTKQMKSHFTSKRKVGEVRGELGTFEAPGVLGVDGREEKFAVVVVEGEEGAAEARRAEFVTEIKPPIIEGTMREEEGEVIHHFTLMRKRRRKPTFEMTFSFKVPNMIGVESSEER